MRTSVQNKTLVTNTAIPLSGFCNVVSLALQGVKTRCNHREVRCYSSTFMK